jgi:hypothetical protein
VETILETKLFPLDCLDTIKNLAPVAGALVLYLSSCRNHDTVSSGIALLNLTLKISKLCYQSLNQPFNPVSNIELEAEIDPRQEVMATGAYFPGKPVCRKLYHIDLDRDQEGGCNKEYYPGTLLFWCAIHKKCLGFYILPSHESVFHVYSILLTRWERLPKVVIYDNGCNLVDYIMNRSPQEFISTIVMSDGFHWVKHDNCGDMFNSSAYAALKDFNSVLHEQMNRFLDKLKPISIHMRLDSFAEILIYTLTEINNRAY